MKKKVILNNDASLKLLKGIDTLADAVASTLGPSGRTVILESGINIWITKDGVSVANQISLEDPVENIGAQLVKQVAQKTVETVGDGTTTSIVLARSIYRKGLEAIAKDTKIDPVLLKKGIDMAVGDVVVHLKSQSVGISDPVMIEQIGTISSNNEPGVGKMIADAITQVGPDGVVTVEPSHGKDTTIDLVQGMQFESGWISNQLITDTKRNECQLDNPLILVTDKSLTSMKELIPILEIAAHKGQPILIVCENMEGEALATFIVNKMRGAIAGCVVRAPWYNERGEGFKDVALYTGATMVGEDSSKQLKDVTLAYLGTAKSVLVGKSTTTIYAGGGAGYPITKEHIESLKEESEKANEYVKRILRTRIGRLAAGVAVIRVGGTSELEMRERFDRFEDSLFATKAAIAEGVVPGGGIALFKASCDISLEAKPSGSVGTGYWLVMEAIQDPLITIIENTGKKSKDIVMDLTVLYQSQRDSFNSGYDAQKEAVVDMFAAGIIDPAKVVRLCLENAASIAGLLLTAQTLVHDIPEPLIERIPLLQPRMPQL